MLHEHRYLSCEPATILTGVSLAVAAGGAASSIAGQSAQNSAAKQVESQKAEAVNDQITENRRRATADYIAKVQDEQLQQAQEMQALEEKELDLAKRERHATAQTIVAASESGVAGQSLAAIQNDYRLQMDQAAARLGINQEQANYAHTRNIQAYGTEYQNRATAVMPYQKQPVKPVDYFGPIFGVAGAGLDMGVRTGAFVGTGQKMNPLTQAMIPAKSGGPQY
jgi:hypothetical protein